MAKKVSNAIAIATTITSTFGTGILFMPSGFKMLGIGNALMAITAIAVVTFYTLYSLAHSALVACCNKEASYSLLAQELSPHLKQIVDFILMGRTLGTSLAITRCFVSSAAVLMNEIHPKLELELLRRMCIFLFITPACYFLTRTRISSLSFIPKLSLCGIFLYIAITSYYAFFYGQSISKLKPATPQYTRGFIKFIFALHCQSSFLNIFNEMESHSYNSILAVTFIASAGAAMIYTLSGFLGYLAAGDDIGEKHMLEIIRDKNHPLMKAVHSKSFDKAGVLPIAVNICFFFIWFGFVVFAYFPFIAIVQSKLSSRGLKASRRTIVVFIAAFLLIGSLPRHLQISKLLDVNAALFTNPLGFILPSLFTIMTERSCTLRSLIGAVLICVSLFISVGVLYNVIAV